MSPLPSKGFILLRNAASPACYEGFANKTPAIYSIDSGNRWIEDMALGYKVSEEMGGDVYYMTQECLHSLAKVSFF
jgi:hypothetical protein